MKNSAKDEQGNAIYDLHYNKKADTIRVTMFAKKETIITIHNPSRDEVEYFIDGTPTARDVRNTFLI